MLEVTDLAAGYGAVQVLRGLTLTARAGEITCLVGRNGAGKTTALKAIMGILPARGGRVAVGGVTVSGLPAHRVAGFGIGYVPQGRRLFGEMTVAENLEIGLMARGSPRAARERALALFPRLGERLAQRADTLSGGEQQMLAMARALCVEPKVLLLDEPTEGLQPSMVEAIREVTLALREAGTAVLLVEQRQEAILTLADRVVFIEMGKGVGETEGDALRAEPERLAERLGV